MVEPPPSRFYAGIPLPQAGNIKPGTLYPIDFKPRDCNTEQLDALRERAHAAQGEPVHGGSAA